MPVELNVSHVRTNKSAARAVTTPSAKKYNAMYAHEYNIKNILYKMV